MANKKDIRNMLEYLRQDVWKTDSDVPLISHKRKANIEELVKTLNDERKRVRHKTYEFLENQKFLVTARIRYYKLLQDYEALRKKHNKAMKLVDGIRAVIKNEI